MPWGNDPLPYARELTDWNGDGIPDLIQGHTFALGTTNKLPWKFAPVKSLLPQGQMIDHRSWRGDDWEFTVAVDFDKDSRKDILFGDYWGNVWFHKNTSTGNDVSFDTTGVRISTAQGKLVTVGRTTPKEFDFDTMQGPRTSLVTGDFDGDGNVDLVVNDVFGHYYFCRRGKHGKEPVVESQVLIAEIGGYATTHVVDWDRDGRLDLLVSQLQKHMLFKNVGGTGSEGLFANAEKLDLPLVPVIGAVVRAFTADANRDGDRDLLILSDHGYDCLFEDSYLRRGYAKAEFVRLQRKKP
jgi:hypothetical protein